MRLPVRSRAIRHPAVALLASFCWAGPAMGQAGGQLPADPDHLAHPRSAGGQHAEARHGHRLTEEQAEFLARARQATRAYRELSAAVRDGFRPVGADAPAMGRHWVHPGRLLDDTIDPEMPEILTYVEIGRRSLLVGVGFAYAVPPRLGSGDSRPTSGPFPPEAWHVHAGSLDRESHRVDHVGALSPSDRSAGEGMLGGVSVLHAWVWTENPAGPVEPNNWTLPYLRIGISHPPEAPQAAAKSLSLASTGFDFFAERLRAFDEPGTGSRDTALAELRAVEKTIKGWWGRRASGPLSEDEVAWLVSQWSRLEGDPF